MGMRVEKDTDGRDIVVSYDKEGKFEWAASDAQFVGRQMYTISDETVAELEGIVKEQGKTLYPKRKGGLQEIPINMGYLVGNINECMTFFETDFVFGWEVENQTALRKMLEAFNELGEEGGRTVPERYLKNAKMNRNGLRIIQGVVDPKKFSEAIDSLFHKEQTGKPKRQHFVHETQRRLAYMCHNLFLELGMEINKSEVGCLQRFLKVIFRDPVIREELGYPIETVNMLIKKALKEDTE